MHAFEANNDVICNETTWDEDTLILVNDLAKNRLETVYNGPRDNLVTSIA